MPPVRRKGRPEQDAPSDGEKIHRQSKKFDVSLFLMALVPAAFCFYSESRDFPQLPAPIQGICTALAILLLLAGSPVSHHLAATRKSRYMMWQPFEGGKIFCLLQACGWVLYSSTWSSTLLFLYEEISLRTYHRGVLAIIAASGVLSQAFVLASLPFFRGATRPTRKKKPIAIARDTDSDTLFEESSSSEEVVPAKRHGPTDGRWNSIVAITLLMACVAATAFVLVEYGQANQWDNKSFFPIGLVAAIMLFSAVPITHGVGGTRMSGGKQEFKFVQAFEGGTAFMVLQGLAWAFYGLFVLLGGITAYAFFTKMQLFRGLVATMGTFGLTAQILVLMSLFWWRGQSGVKAESLSRTQILREEFHKLPLSRKAVEALHDFRAFVLVSLFYLVPLNTLAIVLIGCYLCGRYWFIIAGMFISMLGRARFVFYGLCGLCVLFSWDQPTLLLVLAGGVAYWRSYANRPHVTGVRRSEWVRNLFLWKDMERYFSLPNFSGQRSSSVMGADLSPTETYLFGFHPHGIYPVTAMWMGLSPSWHERYPGITYDTVSATILLQIPIMRDIILSFGTRDVSRDSISRALSDKRSLLIIPGGQHEMREHTDDPNHVNVVSKHKGFVRMAIMHGATLVPVFSFNENQVMSNIHAPSWQKWFQRRIGFGFPHFPYGRWFLPIPHPVNITIAVGDPIKVTQMSEPSQEEVDRVHKQYFENLLEVFEKYKAKLGFQDAQLHFVNE